MIEEMRRAITGHDAQGKSVFTVAEQVPKIEVQLYPGASYWLVWGTEDGDATVGRNHDPIHQPFFPGPGGSRLIAVRFAPAMAAGSAAGGTTSPEKLAAMRAEADRYFPGLFEAHAADREDSAFHTTATVDYGFLVEGELFLRLDDGQEQRLTPGSFVVQRGTRHAWINRSDQPALMVFVIIGAERLA